MNNNAWFKKEKPLLSLQSMSGGAAGSLFQGAADKTYVDDVFSNYVYKGNSSSQTITNGIDFSSKGGLLWFKNRTDSSTQNILTDTTRGVDKVLYADAQSAEASSTINQSFNSDGWSMNNSYGDMNQNNKEYASWSFAKAPGFFDIVTYTGTGSNQTISHDLGCEPGCIITKKIDSSDNWYTWHRGLPGTNYLKYIYLNDTNGSDNAYAAWAETAPTATHFTVGASDATNVNGGSFIAYVFAGGIGSSDNAVEFDGTGDYLSIPVSNTDFDWGASDSLTIEAFVNLDDISSQSYNSIVNRWGGSGAYSFGIDVKNNGNIFFYEGSGTGSITTHESSGLTMVVNKWYHIAVVKDGTTGRFFINGRACGTFTWNQASTNNFTPIHIGNLSDGNAYPVNGKIADVRITMDQALYKVNTNGDVHYSLTQTSQGAQSSNVKLLCCNKSSVTGSTVTPGTITANGDASITTNNSIFDDTAANVFGGDGDKNIIRCGYYYGNDDSSGPIIDLGWEPSFILVKRSTSATNGDWRMFDNIRGLSAPSQTDSFLEPNTTDAEQSNLNCIDITARNFELKSSDTNWNGAGDTYIYIAIRRPDGYVGKPIEDATKVFAIDSGNGSSTIPSFDSTFPVDFAIYREYQSVYAPRVMSRLTSSEQLVASSTAAESDIGLSDVNWDSNVGFGNASYLDTSQISWMWKRHAGMDVVTYTGNDVDGRWIPHSLNNTPEMIWVKRRSHTGQWVVGHKGLDGGSAPWTHYLTLETTDQEYDYPLFYDTAPTSTFFTVGGHGEVNGNAKTFIAMLFASVTGVSKVGSYDGSATSQTITTGFQPKMVLIKEVSVSGQSWWLLDTYRGWAGANDKGLQLNASTQEITHDFGAPTSTGFTLVGSHDGSSNAGKKYIYYAHA